MKFAQIKDLMYYIYYVGDLPMREIIAFFKSIFFMNDNYDTKVGLSQFKKEQETPVEKKKLELILRNILEIDKLQNKLVLMKLKLVLIIIMLLLIILLMQLQLLQLIQQLIMYLIKHKLVYVHHQHVVGIM